MNDENLFMQFIL